MDSEWHDKLRQEHPWFDMHNHTDFSNNRIIDSINKVKDLIFNAKQKGMAGIGITDHGNISGHIKIAKLMDQYPSFFNGKDGHGTFKVVLGSEIYLVDKPIIDKARKHNNKTKFFHFIVSAVDNYGYHALRIISSNSWQNAFWFRGMRRVPTYKDWLNKLMNDPKNHFKGHLIVDTACLGSELSQSILAKDKSRAKKYIKYLIDTFGKDNIYYEMMPADNRHGQQTVNKVLWNISHGNGYFADNTGKGIPCIISTDSHYIDSRDRLAHTVYLKSKNPGRDVQNFYYYAHLFTYDEMRKYFDDDVLQKATQNSMQLLKRYAPIEHHGNVKKLGKDKRAIHLYYKQEIPTCPVPNLKPQQVEQLFTKYNIHANFSKHPWIHRFIHSKFKADRYYMYLFIRGMHKHQLPWDETYMHRMDEELNTLHALTEYFNMPMSQYMLSVRYAVIDSCWQAGSLVGIGRGSSGSFLGIYCLGINAVNPIKHLLYYWRFINAERKDSMPDVDIDETSQKRPEVIRVLRKKYGKNRILNFSTFTTAKPKSAVMTACRGMGIYYKQAQNIASLIPVKPSGMGNVSIHTAFYGNKKHHIKPAQKFINMVHQHKGLANVIQGISGVISNISEHASGVAIFNEPSYTYRNAMMLTNKGIPVSQYSAHDSEYCSTMKMDILTLSALDKIQEAIRLLLRNGKIKWQGTLHKTYEKYFATEKLMMGHGKTPEEKKANAKMFKILYSGQMIDAFEFSTLVGRNILYTLKPNNLESLTAANALMRLTVDKGEQPAHRYLRYTHHPEQWDEDMKKAGLSYAERKIMHKELDRFRGVCYSQESLMHISMNPKIANFNMLQANHLRKAIATKDHKLQAQEKKLLFKKGHQQGTSDNLLNYVWTQCAKPAENYSFNLAHGTAYSIILLIEMNICYRYGTIYWNTASLSVNSGIYGDVMKNPDYTKMGRAMANPEIRKHLTNPSINHSGYGFVPYNNHILYGLYPISGIGADVATKIIKNRPYSSFNDFLKKTQLSKRENIQLIKAGCFDDFNKNHDKDFRVKLMAKYVSIVKPLKKRLTMTQVPKVRQYIPSKYAKMVKVYDFRSKITGRKKVPMNKSIKHEFLTKYAKYVEPYAHKGQTSLFKNPSKADTMSYTTDKKGHFKINVKAFNKWYNKYVKPLKNWLKTKPALVAEARKRRKKLWYKYCYGDTATWEMDALGCYIGTHELDNTPLKKQYNIADYSKVPKQNDFNQNHPKAIYGTVIGKNANKHLVYLLTPQGIANVRVSKRRYSAYNKRNKKVTNSFSSNPYLNKIATKAFKGSWFSRGNRLLTRGSKVGDNFFINWNEKKYPLYFIVNYDKDARAVDLYGKPAPMKPQYRKNSGFMRHKQYQRNQQIMHQQEQKRNQVANQMIKHRNQQIDNEFNQIASKGKLSSANQIASTSHNSNASFDSSLTSICKSLNVDFSNPNWTVPSNSTNQGRNTNNSSSNSFNDRDIEQICTRLNRKFND